MKFEGVRSFLNGLLISEGGVAGSERWEVSPQNWWGNLRLASRISGKWEAGLTGGGRWTHENGGIFVPQVEDGKLRPCHTPLDLCTVIVRT